MPEEWACSSPPHFTPTSSHQPRLHLYSFSPDYFIALSACYLSLLYCWWDLKACPIEPAATLLFALNKCYFIALITTAVQASISLLYCSVISMYESNSPSVSVDNFHCLYWHIVQLSTLGSCLPSLSFPPTGAILAFILNHYFNINEMKVTLALQWPKGRIKRLTCQILKNVSVWRFPSEISLSSVFVDCYANSVITLESAKDFNGNLRLEAVFGFCHRDSKQSQ